MPELTPAGSQPLGRRWLPRHPNQADPAAVAALSRSLRLPPTLCALLVLRGHADDDAARRFLRPPLELHDPLGLAGMDEAVQRLARAARAGERVLVHGDYDVDGMCAAALLTRVLRRVGARAAAFVPHRSRDGYDLGPAGLEAARRAGASLVVTADCGVLAHDAVRAIRAEGLDVVVTDHHAPGDTLPAALAVVNPNRADCRYPDKGLCGTGVAYKLCDALLRRLGADASELRWHLDLVALATVADLMPLVGENRVFVHYGLKVLRQTRSPGLAALLEVAGLGDGRPLVAGHLSHVLGPRLNAIGRLDDAGLGVRLLLTDDAREAGDLARRLEEANLRRKRVDREMLDQALEALASSFEPGRDRAVVLSGGDWHPGVIGIVASRVVERIHRPTFLLSVDPKTGRARGSGRSIPGFDLVAALRECAPLLDRFGGHRMAAGLDIPEERIGEFRAALNRVATERINEEALTPVTSYDLDLPLRLADADLQRFFRHAGPFGIGNPTPAFLARGVSLEGPPRIVGRDHLRLRLVQDGARLAAIGFRMADRAEALARASALDIVYQLHEDEYRGRRRIQAKLVDVRGSEATVTDRLPDPGPPAGAGPPAREAVAVPLA